MLGTSVALMHWCPISAYWERFPEKSWHMILSQDGASSAAVHVLYIVLGQPVKLAVAPSDLRLRLDQWHNQTAYPLSSSVMDGRGNWSSHHRNVWSEGVVKPTMSPCSECSPIGLVHQKDGSPWFCVDFQKLNTIITCKLSYILKNGFEA